MLKTYDSASKVPSLVLMLVCIKAGFCFEKELEFVHTNYVDCNVVVMWIKSCKCLSVVAFL